MKFHPSVILLLAIGVQSFWDVGHMLVASVGEIRLERDDPEALIKFRKLIESINFLCDNRSHTLIESSVWPDDLKEQKYKMGLWDSWHFGDTYMCVDLAPTWLTLLLPQ